MTRLTDALLASLVPLLILLHLVLAPYSKVEESFSIQATHDILTYGLPFRDIAASLRPHYDHFTFPSPVPRTFVGPLAVAGVSWPFIHLVEGVNRQILVRAILGLYNAFCILSFRNGMVKAFGRTAANWYIVFQASQFHVMYYASRTLPNFYAFGLSTLALRCFLPVASGTTFPSKRTINGYRLGLCILTVLGVVFRSEIALLLFMHTAWLFIQGRISLVQDIIPSGLLGLLIGVLLTVPIDSYFYLSFPLWPELESFIFNVVHGQSVTWGTHPFQFYLTDSLPRLLLNPLALPLLIPFALTTRPLRSAATSLLLPNLAFILLYSFQPHKEWRFIVYAIPPTTAATALSASWIWTRRAKSLAYRFLALSLVASTFASFAVSFGMLAASRLNYPGAEALNRLHARAHGEKKVLSVHMGTLACMTGVTRFMELPGPKSRDISVAQAHGTLWVYDKTDDSGYTAEEAKSSSILSPNAKRDQLLHPEFWNRFDYVLAERPEKVIGQWEVLDVVDGFAGIKFLRPGEEEWVDRESTFLGRSVAKMEWEDVSGEMARVWRRLEGLARRYVTRGWWVGARMEPKIRILKRQRGAIDTQR
ncbi:GPI mannosyltransferase [Lasallia pustulata]|uniref:Mannosyltransferase n=1 Tax=Lasallia pustulata TaxID=136370 RepID=A0A1W5DAB5_9LECA|nr:GPI mannosyltransferase [Lasallia pustulata]